MDKNKTKCTIFVVATALIIICGLIFSSFAAVRNNDNAGEYLKNRINILQSYYFDNVELDKATAELKRIETGKLLDNDLLNMKTIQNTDFHRIMRMYVVRQEIVSNFTEYHSYLVTMESTMRQNNEFVKEEDTYYVVLQKSGKTYKLSQMHLQNKNK